MECAVALGGAYGASFGASVGAAFGTFGVTIAAPASAATGAGAAGGLTAIGGLATLVSGPFAAAAASAVASTAAIGYGICWAFTEIKGANSHEEPVHQAEFARRNEALGEFRFQPSVGAWLQHKPHQPIRIIPQAKLGNKRLRLHASQAQVSRAHEEAVAEVGTADEAEAEGLRAELRRAQQEKEDERRAKERAQADLQSVSRQCEVLQAQIHKLRSELNATQRQLEDREQQVKQLESREDSGLSQPAVEEVFSSIHGCKADFCLQLTNFLKEGQHLPEEALQRIISDAMDVLKSSKTLVDLKVPDEEHITICGDIHGQFLDLLEIFATNGPPSEENPYIFNGDFVDRGAFSIEVIVTLFSWKIAFPHHVHLCRGNHETQNINSRFGFLEEVKTKYADGCTGWEDNVTLDTIKDIDRVHEPPKNSIMEQLLWSDPQMENGLKKSPRNAGVCFGPDITERFLNTNRLKMVIRSHEFKHEGYDIQHKGKVVTVFSAPNYCGKRNNKGAFIRLNVLNGRMMPEYVTFAAAVQ